MRLDESKADKSAPVSASSTESGDKAAASVITPDAPQNAAEATTAPSKPPRETIATSGGNKVPVWSYDFVGDHLPDGRPVLHLGSHDIPPRLLTRDEYLALTPAQRKAIKAHPELYKPVSERAYGNRVKRDEDAAANQTEIPIERRVDPAYLIPTVVPDADDDDDGDDLVDESE